MPAHIRDFPPLKPNTLESLNAHLLSAADIKRLNAIGMRGHQITLNHQLGGVPDIMRQLNPQILSTDVAVCHLHRNLNLPVMLACNDLDFIAEFSTIQKYINRDLMFFPWSVKLRFARWGATFHN